MFYYLGRWLCPRSGTVSMAQKAVMLFHNFAVTSDILDLFRLLKEEKVSAVDFSSTDCLNKSVSLLKHESTFQRRGCSNTTCRSRKAQILDYLPYLYCKYWTTPVFKNCANWTILNSLNHQCGRMKRLSNHHWVTSKPLPNPS